MIARALVHGHLPLPLASISTRRAPFERARLSSNSNHSHMLPRRYGSYLHRRAFVSSIIPAHTRHPGEGDIPVALSDQFVAFLSLLLPLHTESRPVTLLLPLLTQTHGGVALWKMSACPERSRGARRHFLSLLSQSLISTLFLFYRLRTLLFSVAHLSSAYPALVALFTKNQGCSLTWSCKFLSSGTNLQNPPAPDPSAALRAGGGRYKTQEGTIYRAPTKRRVDWHRSPVINHQPALSEAEASLPLLHLLPLPHLLPVPRVPTLPRRASTTTSTNPHTPTEVTPT